MKRKGLTPSIFSACLEKAQKQRETQTGKQQTETQKSSCRRREAPAEAERQPYPSAVAREINPSQSTLTVLNWPSLVPGAGRVDPFNVRASSASTTLVVAWYAGGSSNAPLVLQEQQVSSLNIWKNKP